ncbi:TolC family protein [Candidatus Skiveiella danica]|uniref:TolC family protein n=1 Tax=Candidatus Skiveiella danica TaxID=3386177 RepID=UPI0039B8652C
MLRAIVDEAVAHNPDLRAAAARVAIAQQTVVVVGSKLLPSIGIGLNARALDDQDRGSTGSTAVFLSAAWEADVWGRLRAQQAAAWPGTRPPHSTTPGPGNRWPPPRPSSGTWRLSRASCWPCASRPSTFTPG